MLKPLSGNTDETFDPQWMIDFYDGITFSRSFSLLSPPLLMTDFSNRFVNLLGYAFKKFGVKTAMSILGKERKIDEGAFALDGKKKNFFGARNPICMSLFNSFSSHPTAWSRADLDRTFSSYDLKRLSSYSQNLIDYHAIVDLVPTLAREFFAGKNAFSDNLSLSAGQVHPRSSIPYS